MIFINELYVGKPILYDGGNYNDEYGFITGWDGHFVYCRFFRYDRPSKLKELRTVTKSEACDVKRLYSFPLNQENINNIIDEMRANPETYGWVEQEL